MKRFTNCSGSCYNVLFWGLSWTPLPTLISDVINGRSLACQRPSLSLLTSFKVFTQSRWFSKVLTIATAQYHCRHYNSLEYAKHFFFVIKRNHCFRSLNFVFVLQPFFMKSVEIGTFIFCSSFLAKITEVPMHYNFLE